MNIVRETDPDAPPVPKKLPDEIKDDEKPKDDTSWTTDQSGVSYSIYRDRNGEVYDPYYIVGAIFWNYYITYISLFLHFCVMTYMLDYWCNYSKLMMGYSF